MFFVSGYQMFFDTFKLEQIYNSILFQTMVFINNYYSSKNDRVWPRNATITNCWPTRHGTMRKGHKVGILQAVTVQFMYISSSFSFQSE